MALEKNLGFPHTPVPGHSIICHQGLFLQYFFPVFHRNQGSAKLMEPSKIFLFLLLSHVISILKL